MSHSKGSLCPRLIAAAALTAFMLLPSTSTAGTCTEVDKGKIPAEHLKAELRELPGGIRIWGVDDALPPLKSGDAKVVWVDTRPNSFYGEGSLKGALNLVYHKDEQLKFKGQTDALTEAALAAAAGDDSTLVFFCQGPKCHRSYNAALHAVCAWGYPAERVVWFRDGYPLLLKRIEGNPKLKKRMFRYLQGSVVD